METPGGWVSRCGSGANGPGPSTRLDVLAGFSEPLRLVEVENQRAEKYVRPGRSGSRWQLSSAPNFGQEAKVGQRAGVAIGENQVGHRGCKSKMHVN